MVQFDFGDDEDQDLLYSLLKLKSGSNVSPLPQAEALMDQSLGHYSLDEEEVLELSTSDLLEHYKREYATFDRVVQKYLPQLPLIERKTRLIDAIRQLYRSNLKVDDAIVGEVSNLPLCGLDCLTLEYILNSPDGRQKLLYLNASMDYLVNRNAMLFPLLELAYCATYVCQNINELHQVTWTRIFFSELKKRGIDEETASALYKSKTVYQISSMVKAWDPCVQLGFAPKQIGGLFKYTPYFDMGCLHEAAMTFAPMIQRGQMTSNDLYQYIACPQGDVKLKKTLAVWGEHYRSGAASNLSAFLTQTTPLRSINETQAIAADLQRGKFIKATRATFLISMDTQPNAGNASYAGARFSRQG